MLSIASRDMIRTNKCSEEGVDMEGNLILKSEKQMSLMEKLRLLADAAKFDVS